MCAPVQDIWFTNEALDGIDGIDCLLVDDEQNSEKIALHLQTSLTEITITYSIPH